MPLTSAVAPIDLSMIAGTSGTSTPSKDNGQVKDGSAAKRDSYKSTALEEIRRSIQTYKKDEPKEADAEVGTDAFQDSLP